MANRVGVLALQGAFRAHLDALVELDLDAIEVRNAAELATCDRVIIPGGESTTMSMMLDRNELREPLAAALADGMPAFGTCAGMILLATDVSDGRPDQESFGRIDIGVRRNGYGRQNQSFSDALAVEGIPDFGDDFHAVFIRAPRVERLGEAVGVLARYDGEPVLCRQGSVLVASFHPELSPDRRLHRYFCDLS
ncbi:MAG: pyridoxal 5'-phosphate synthase glutaminase subunit PdxT [Actinomycetota bacterium]